MKKILTILCSAMVLMTVSSCTKQYVTPNPNITIIQPLDPSGWKSFTDSAGVPSYTYSININNNQSFDEASGIIVSISYNNGDSYEQLPEVYGNLSYSYTYTAGNITIYAQTADGTAAVNPGADNMKVKIVLVSSNLR